MDYLISHSKLFKRSQRANSFVKFYIAVPYIAFLIGYFVSVLLGSFANKFGRFMCGGIHLIVIACAIVFSVAWFFKKYRLSKRAVRNFNKRNSMSNAGGEHNDSIASSDESEKPVDKSYADGKRRLADGLYEYNGLKFVPGAWSFELSHHVSDVRVSVSLFNKDTFGAFGKLVLHGNVQCNIRREASYPNDVAQEVLDKVVENIQSRANELLDELADTYSNYNKKFTIDCSGIKISYKIV
ncbi:MAG: hypothetical protein K2F90_02870 [Clostridiales bacterium]|nr:hypothetical protein [Clostridiales bacterium]